MDTNTNTSPRQYLRLGVFLKSLWILEGFIVIALVWGVLNNSPDHGSFAGLIYYPGSLIAGLLIIFLSIFIERYIVLELITLVIIFTGIYLVIPSFVGLLQLTHIVQFNVGGPTYDPNVNFLKGGEIDLLSFVVFGLGLSAQVFLTKRAF